MNKQEKHKNKQMLLLPELFFTDFSVFDSKLHYLLPNFQISL